MRRTRSPWQYALFSVPVVFAAGGFYYLSKNSDVHGHRAIASVKTVATVPATTAAVTTPTQPTSEIHELQKVVQQQVADLEEDQDEPDQDLKTEEKAFPVATVGTAENRQPASASDGMCTSVETPVKNLDSVKPTTVQWEAVMKEFHTAKASVTHWLGEHKSQFSEKTFQWMNKRVAETELIRPPTATQPDLAWRGIATLGNLNTETPGISVGGGMIQWVTAHPERARFEFARLLAQNWAPCEVAKVDATAPWKELVQCLDLSVEADPSKACGAGSYSEAGWAVSSVVGAAASPPGCKIPAFDNTNVAGCVKKMGVKL